MSRRPPKLGDRKPRAPVRDKRVKDGEWVISIKLVQHNTCLYEGTPLVVVDSQLQNVGSLVEAYCDEKGAKYAPKRARKK